MTQDLCIRHCRTLFLTGSWMPDMSGSSCAVHAGVSEGQRCRYYRGLGAGRQLVRLDLASTAAAAAAAATTAKGYHGGSAAAAKLCDDATDTEASPAHNAGRVHGAALSVSSVCVILYFYTATCGPNQASDGQGPQGTWTGPLHTQATHTGRHQHRGGPSGRDTLDPGHTCRHLKPGNQTNHNLRQIQEMME